MGNFLSGGIFISFVVAIVEIRQKYIFICEFFKRKKNR